MDATLQWMTSPLFLEHECSTPHVENAMRLKTILEGIQTHPVLGKMASNFARPAKDREILRTHTRELLSQLQETSHGHGFLDPDTFYSPKSFDSALAAVGGTVDLAKKIWQGEVRRGFSLVRPPGHHATREESMGFCLLNNVAIAVQAVLDADPAARVAIVDFDLHHGNGTQWIFYNEPRVLFLSSHRYPYYPGTGGLEEVGEGKGKGLNVNFPLSERLPGAFFTSLYCETVSPILEEFSPDMVVVSAGYDGHISDPMRGFRIETEDYRVLTKLLIDLAEKTAKGRILFCLEGGYDPMALRDSVIASLEELLEPKVLLPILSTISPLQENFQKYFSQYFPSLR